MQDLIANTLWREIGAYSGLLAMFVLSYRLTANWLFLHRGVRIFGALLVGYLLIASLAQVRLLTLDGPPSEVSFVVVLLNVATLAAASLTPHDWLRHPPGCEDPEAHE